MATRQLAPLLIKPPSRLAPLFFWPRLLVIVLNLTPAAGRPAGTLAEEEKKPQLVRVTDSPASQTFISSHRKGLHLAHQPLEPL